MKIVRTFKYKLRPNRTQAQAIDRWIHTCRAVYNLSLETKIYAWNRFKVSLSKYDLHKQLPDLKRDNPWIKEVHSQTLQDVVERMCGAFDKFFAGGGFPRWARRDRYRSFAFKQSVQVCGHHVTLPKLGTMRFRKSRDLGGTIKRTTIVKEVDGYYICFACEIEHVPPHKPHESHVGIDMGVAHFYASSEGHLEPNPHILNQYLRQLRREQRSLARKKQGSRSRDKQKRKLAKLHLKISRVRNDHHHKLSTALVRRNQVIAIEDLKLRNMTRSAKGTIDDPGTNVKAKAGLNRSLLDAAAGTFFSQLQYKAEWYGCELVRVDPRNTSRMCKACGHVDGSSRRKEHFHCTACGHEAHADINAAQNILARALASVSERRH